MISLSEGVLMMWETRYNSLADLIDFFSTPDKPVSSREFFEFWISLSYEQMEYYRSVDLWEARRAMRG